MGSGSLEVTDEKFKSSTVNCWGFFILKHFDM
jgi:hypothetical protein